MKITSNRRATRISRQAFTLVELMVSSTIGLGLTGTVVLMLLQSAAEERNGFADTTVEERAYTLQANLTTCLRSMSANQGVTTVGSSQLYGNSGNALPEYQSIFVFSPTNSGYTTASISYNSSSGLVVYTPNVLIPSTQVVWMSNSATAVLTKFCFSTSQNLDSSVNSSLVNVQFQMTDNGFSQQNSTNNPASILRNFSVQMRNDN